MGSAYSNVLELVESEFLRVQGAATIQEAGRGITYAQLRQVRLPDEFTLDFSHVGVLYCLDANKDGWFSYDDVVGFVRFVALLPHSRGADGDFCEMVQARCWLRVWKDVIEEGSSESTVSWMLHFLEKCHPDSVKHVVSLEPSSPPRSSGGFSPSAGTSDSSDESDDGLHPPQKRASVANHYGAACVALLHDVLRVGEVYQLDFISFAELVSCGGSLEAATKSPTVPAASHDKVPLCPGVVGEVPDDASRSDAAAATVQLEIPPVPEAELRLFLRGFFDGVWATLSQLGLSVLAGRASTAHTVAPLGSRRRA